jgi:hypothetical protein
MPARRSRMNEKLAFSALTEEERKGLRSDLLWELRRLIIKYNNGSGSSIRNERAENIFKSMIYCISAYLRSIPVPEEKVRNTQGGELFRTSLAFVKKKVHNAEKLYGQILDTRVDTDLRVYNETLDEGLPAFFQLYNPEFDAQDTPAIIDYPIHHQRTDLSGIEFILEYLEELKKENVFCTRYRKNQIRAVLFLYGRRYHMCYQELIVNIPETMVRFGRKCTSAKQEIKVKAK